jgi:uncharacterized membrane protein
MRTTALERTTQESRYGVRKVERWGSVAMGSALLAFGLSHRSKMGIGAAAAGATLLYRGASGHWPVYGTIGMRTAEASDTRAALSGPRGFHVREAIVLERPIEEVYRFWRSFENFPQFMNHLERVVDLGNEHSHWVAKGPAGSSVEWDAEIINEVPNKVIGWKSLPKSDLVTAGSVNFDAMRGGQSTQVTVHLQYAPPGGRLGKLVAQLFGDEPSQAIREDLHRMKRLLESGEKPPTLVSPSPRSML